MSPAGAWDALARLLPAECPRRDLEAVAPSAPGGSLLTLKWLRRVPPPGQTVPPGLAGRASRRSRPDPGRASRRSRPEPAAPGPLGLAASPAARRAPARAASPATHWPALERRLAGRQCPQKLREGGRGREEGDEGEGEGGRGWISERRRYLEGEEKETDEREEVSSGDNKCWTYFLSRVETSPGIKSPL